MRKKILLATVALLGTFFVVVLAAEVYLRYRSTTDNLIRAYTPELHTHDGRTIPERTTRPLMGL